MAYTDTDDEQDQQDERERKGSNWQPWNEEAPGVTPPPVRLPPRTAVASPLDTAQPMPKVASPLTSSPTGTPTISSPWEAAEAKGQTMGAPPPVASPLANTDPYAEYHKAVTNKPGVDTIHNPFLHVLGKIGDIGGSIFAPGATSMIPGTTFHHGLEVQRALHHGQEAEKENEQELTDTQQQQRIQKAVDEAATDTPEKRQAYVAQNPDLFKNLSDFEKNDYALSGKFPQREPTPPKTENLQQNYADAVAAAVKAGKDPLQDPTAQHYADAITALQKQPSPPKDMTAKPGTVNGQPAWGIQTDQGWMDPETRQMLHGFKPQPTFAETGLWDPTMLQTPQGMVPGRFNKRTGQTEPLPPQNAPIPKEAGHQIDVSLDQARNMDRLKTAQEHILTDAGKRGQMGMAGGGPYLNGPESMQFLANHIAMTFGGVKGARVGRDLIQEHIRARDLDQATEALAQSVLSGGVITNSQAKQMLTTTEVNRRAVWGQAKEAAKQYGVPDAVQVPPDIDQQEGGAGHSFIYNGQQYHNVPDALYNKYKGKPGFKE